ncbi:MAG: alpha/beta hydrolase [Thermoanaerobaculia bacterium]
MAGITEERIATQSHLYADVYLPEGVTRPPLVIALHGYGGEKSSMLRLARRIFGDELALASLQGPHPHIVYPKDRGQPLGFGFGWVTNFKPEESIALHHGALRELLSRLGSRAAIDPSRVFLLGFSQSVAVNFRFAFTHPDLVSGVVGICGGIPGDWSQSDRYRQAAFDVLLVGGARDEFYPPDRTRANAEKLRERAGSVEVLLLEAGHEIPAASFEPIRGWVRRRS